MTQADEDGDWEGEDEVDESDDGESAAAVEDHSDVGGR